MKRIAAFTICMLIVLSVQLSIDAQVDHKERVVSSESTVDGSDILAPGMTKVDANTRFTLYINRSDGLIGLEDKVNGNFLYSYPYDLESYSGVDYSEWGTVKSQLLLETVDEKGGTQPLYSHVDSTEKEGLRVRKEGNSAVCYYTFPDEGITVVLECYLEEDGLVVKVDPKRVTEQGSRKISSIAVLPYFDAIRPEEEGYVFIPDGSGALISNQPTMYAQYQQDVFGQEAVLEVVRRSVFQEKILLPVFGVSRGGNGFTGIIHSGYAKCAIAANNGNNLRTLTTVYPIFKMRTLTYVSLPTKNGSAKTVSVLEQNPNLSTPFIGKYIPLDNGNNDYTAMAHVYRRYLMEEQGVRPLEFDDYYDGYIDIYGYVKKEKTILGLPVTVDQKLSDVAQVTEMASNYQGLDAKLGIRYNAWIKNGYMNKLPNAATPSKAVGSKKDIRKLGQQLSNNGMRLFLSSDPVSVYKLGNGFSAFRHAARTVNNIAYVEYTYPVNLYYRNTELPSYRLLSLDFLFNFTSKYLKSFNKLGTGGIALDTIGNTVYSNYGENSLSIFEGEEEIRRTLKTAAENNELMVEAAASYALGIARHSIAAPSESSNYKISSKSVPFYQIALRGLINMSVSALNFDSRSDTLLLRCYETGMLPMYTFIKEEPDVLLNTALSDLYAANYDNWKDVSQDVIKDFTAFNARIKGKTIAAHDSPAKNLTRTVYENGPTVLVNYGEAAVMFEGISIDAMSYFVWEDT